MKKIKSDIAIAYIAIILVPTVVLYFSINYWASARTERPVRPVIDTAAFTYEHSEIKR